MHMLYNVHHPSKDIPGNTRVCDDKPQPSTITSTEPIGLP